MPLLEAGPLPLLTTTGLFTYQNIKIYYKESVVSVQITAVVCKIYIHAHIWEVIV